MLIKKWEFVVMPTYTYIENTHTHTLHLCSLQWRHNKSKTKQLSLNMVVDTKHRIKGKLSGFFKNTNTLCFKLTVNIKYTELEKNV